MLKKKIIEIKVLFFFLKKNIFNTQQNRMKRNNYLRIKHSLQVKFTLIFKEEKHGCLT